MDKIRQNLYRGLSQLDAEKWDYYFYGNGQSLKPRILALYDPFWDRLTFPEKCTLIRACINVYTGCSHACFNCYTQNYITNYMKGRVKKEYRNRLLKDIEEFNRLHLPPLPIHMSNSTDCTQPLEITQKDTLWTLQTLVHNYHIVKVLVMLIRNPELLSQDEYVNVLLQLKEKRVPVIIEVTISILSEEFVRQYEPGAPSLLSRKNGVERLREHGIDVAIRLDPLYPRNPLPEEYGCSNLQTEENIEKVVRWAARIGCSRIITSPFKLCMGKKSFTK